MTKPERGSDFTPLAIDGAPLSCHSCQTALCLRKQVVNLALGNTDTMYCLNCLGVENGTVPEALLTRMRDYALSRDCFKKEWIKYESVAFCPDRAGCLPDICFGGFTYTSLE
ncbi:MAG TPA: hypothetical protein V6C72_05025 [Chroococcales cyanobacterium]